MNIFKAAYNAVFRTKTIDPNGIEKEMLSKGERESAVSNDQPEFSSRRKYVIAAGLAVTAALAGVGIVVGLRNRSPENPDNSNNKFDVALTPTHSTTLSELHTTTSAEQDRTETPSITLTDKNGETWSPTAEQTESIEKWSETHSDTTTQSEDASRTTTEKLTESPSQQLNSNTPTNPNSVTTSNLDSTTVAATKSTSPLQSNSEALSVSETQSNTQTDAELLHAVLQFETNSFDNAQPHQVVSNTSYTAICFPSSKQEDAAIGIMTNVATYQSGEYHPQAHCGGR